MYRRALLSLYGGGISGRRLAGNRYADLVCRRLSVGSVLWSEKSPSENDGTGKASGEAEDKTSQPHKEESTKPNHDALIDLLSGMKIEMSSKKLFMEKKIKKTKQQSQENTDNIESASKMFQMVAEESHPNKEIPVSKELADAASAVASTYPSQERQVESELLQQLRLHKQMAEEIRKKARENIGNVISGMKVTKQKSKTGKQISAEEREFMRDATKKSLQTGKRLKIFTAASEEPIDTEMPPTLWDVELAKEIAYVCEHPPRNGFEEMIQWTKEGKLWTFPIDNEASLEEEQKVEFHEHIFLEKYLEDFPRQGPVRHFMELVICGLSKNPYLTVQQKKDHIDWFHDYFQKKQDLLKEYDAYLN